MSAFITYAPSTGVILCAYSVSHADDLAVIMAANTPSGASSLAVEDGHTVLTDQRVWAVKSGSLVAVTPTDAALLAAAQAAQLAILTASYATAKAANVPYMGTSFMADDDSQQMFAHALVAYTVVGSTPSDFYAVDASYNKVPMTLTQLQGLISAIAAQIWTAFQRWVAVKETLTAATTVAEVQAINW